MPPDVTAGISVDRGHGAGMAKPWGVQVQVQPCGYCVTIPGKRLVCPPSL